VKRYELHYQKKKVKVGDEVLSAQFGYITFHLNMYGDHVKLTPYVKNKWSASWMKTWFYCKVPVQSALGGKSVHVLHYYMTNLEYVTVTSQNFHFRM
jgi:hypothetical protein